MRFSNRWENRLKGLIKLSNGVKDTDKLAAK